MATAQAPSTVDGAVASAGADLRRFARCLERAQAARTPEDAGTCLRQLGDLRAALQQHRAQLRQRIAALGARGAGKDRLGAVRASIEQELRKLQDFERRVGAPLAGPVCGDTEDKLAQKVASPPPGEACPCTSSASSDSGEDAGEVKVLQSQLVRGQGDDDVTQEFVCKICLDVVGCAPRLTRCAHLFCGDCIRQWFTAQPKSQTWAGRAKSAGMVPCPVCKEPLSEKEDLHLVGPGQKGNGAFLWKMLAGTEVRCSNHHSCNPHGRCDWVGTYGSFQAHIQECENVPLCCGSAADVGEALESEVPASPVHCASSQVAASAEDQASREPAVEVGEEAPQTSETHGAAVASAHSATSDEEGPVVRTHWAHDPAQEVLELSGDCGGDGVLMQPSRPGQESPRARLSQGKGAGPEGAMPPETSTALEPLPAFESSPLAHVPMALQQPAATQRVEAILTRTKQQQHKKTKKTSASAAGAADQAAMAAAAGAAVHFVSAAQRQAYAQQVAQWQAAQAAQQMAYAARMQAAQQAAQTQMAYAAQCQMAYAAAAHMQAVHAARVRAASKAKAKARN